MAFIKIDKAIIDSYCFANPKHLKIWLWLLVKANYKKTFSYIKVGVGHSTVEVNRGQMIFGRIKAEEELEMDGTFIYRCLKKFEELEQIKIESAVNYSIITICNYDVYQDKKDNIVENVPPIEHQLNYNSLTTVLQVNTSKEVLEVKEYIEIKEEKPQKFLIPIMEEIWLKQNQNYPSDKTKDFDGLGEISRLISKLLKISYNPSDEDCIISITHEWRKIAEFIVSDGFFKSYSLQQVSKHFQNIIQVKSNGRQINSTSGKQRKPTPAEERDAALSGFFKN